MSAKFFVLMPSFEPLRGSCPVCSGIMDETGCRLGAHYVSRDITRTKGVAQLVEVLFCAGEPQSPVLSCPGCEAVP